MLVSHVACSTPLALVSAPVQHRLCAVASLIDCVRPHAGLRIEAIAYKAPVVTFVRVKGGDEHTVEGSVEPAYTCQWKGEGDASDEM